MPEHFIKIVKMPFLTGLAFLFCATLYAHPMPNSVLLLDVANGSVTAEVQLPLKELELAFGHNLTAHPETVLQLYKPRLQAYLLSHFYVLNTGGKAWKVTITGMGIAKGEQTGTGLYHELSIRLLLTPPPGSSTRSFRLYYDAIIHQVVSHSALVAIRQDWANGQVGEEVRQVGVISMDIKNNTVLPLSITINNGSWYKGFSSMVQLGISHISQGTDHLLFLLVLLLPAPLYHTRRRWAKSMGSKPAMRRIVKIVTAFTIGHSITLIAGALGWVHFSAQAIEVLIAFSILVTAVHALRPLFAGKETYIAAGFGLVHGLAFATTIAGLNLQPGAMALSIFGFNLGIELMQLFIIIMVIPWLIILSEGKGYTLLRTSGALIAAVAATAWMAERITGKANVAAAHLDAVTIYGQWIILGLVLLAGISYFFQKRKNPA